ncbi:phage distal tail protein [Paenibacillus pabuli]|uniref:phage distal tail protein n=1 Tax=Paenibacillus pabuli TaxID=1472 RepID=UPI001FFE8151|nr:hypothetical protein [Paenibacillus pabuli]UPK45777.1 phage tail family protein [Paenibacillus pabuli]
MFNRGAFNRMAFNRQISVFVFGRAVLNGVGGLTAASSAEMTGTVTMDGVGELHADFVREISNAAKLDGEGGLSATFIRERLQKAIMHGVGTLKANGSRFHVDYIDYVGLINPGDRIIIDSKNLKVTKNGSNALFNMQGNFFDLNLGNNTITYTDPDTGRSVLMRITFQDRFV